MQPYEVEPILTVDDELFYRLSTGEYVPAYDIIHLKGLSTDGYKGKSPIAVHRENLALTESAQEYGEKFFNQGGNMSGVFKYPNTLKPDAYKRLKNDLIAQSTGLHNAHSPLLLEGGMTYERRCWLDDNKERFEISVGSTGSFDLCKNEVGDRARFYMDFGKFLSDTTLLNDLKNMLFDYADTMEEIHERMESLQKSLENPLA